MDGAVIIKAENGILTTGTYENMVLMESSFNNPGSMLTTELSNFRKIGE